MNQPLRIGFFDSGVGGLSVLRHAPRYIENAEYLYVADAAYAPYGKQSEEFVLERSLLITHFLMDQKIDALVVACNTATAVAIDEIREKFSLPIIGMEPAIKPALNKTKSKKIAVLCTENTLISERYRTLKEPYLSKLNIYERACHHWVETVEKNNLTSEFKQTMVESDLKPLLEENVDTFILACTHFPFLREQIEKCLPENACVIDPAEAVIKQLANRLDIDPYEKLATNKMNLEVFSSADTILMKEKVESLINSVVKVNVLTV